MVRDDFVQLLLEFEDLLKGDLHIAGLALGSAHGLVNHDAAVLERRTLALGACTQKYGAHRGGHSGANGGNVRGYHLHGVVDSEARVHAAAGAIHVDLNVLFGVGRLQKEELRLDDVGYLVVDSGSEKDDAVHHQARKHVHLGHVELALLDDVGRQ